MSSREVILDRLRMHSPQTHSKMRIAMPEIAKGSIEMFSDKATGAGAKVSVVKGLEEAKARLEEILTEVSGDILLSSEDLLKDLQIEKLPAANNRIITEAMVESLANYKKQAFSSAIGITSCDYAIAETGSLIIEHGNHNERLISLAPPIHICVLKEEQIMENRYMLAKILEGKTKYSSAYSIITGVSRTADVALQVVLGMHGPKNVFIIICTD